MLFLKACIVTVIVGLIQCVDEGEMEKKSVHHRMHDFAHKRCKNNAFEVLERFEEEKRRLKHCIDHWIPHINTTDTIKELQSKCFENRETTIKCVQKAVDFIVPCLPKEEAYIPSFIVELYKGTSKYLCDHIEVLTFTGLLETKLIRCLNKFKKHWEYNPHHVCYDKVKFAHFGVITKEELCDDIDMIIECYEKQFKEHCPEAPKAWEFESGLLNGAKQPCRKQTDEE